MLEIVKYITTHADWETSLAEAPYSLRIKREGKLVMFNYTQAISQPSEIVNEARGLILEEGTWRVVRYGFYRFYNAHEPGAAQVDMSTAFAFEKIDGSLVMLYYYNGWHMSTRSTFDARTASVGESGVTFEELITRAMQAQNIQFSNLDPNVTYVFELVSPESQVVIHYEDTKLYFLMARDNITLEELFFPAAMNWLRPQVYQFTTLEDVERYVSSFEGKEFEGVVLMDASHNRVKVKNLNWLRMHKLHNNGRVTTESVLDMILTGEAVEYLTYFPEHTMMFTAVEQKYNQLVSYAHELDAENYAEKFPVRKWFAMDVANSFRKQYRTLAFKAYEGKAAEWIQTLSAAQIIKGFWEED